MTTLRPLPVGDDRLIEQVRVTVIPGYACIIGIDQHDVESEAMTIVVGQRIAGGSLVAISAHRSLGV